MSTRSSIWIGYSKGKCVHLYWELAERESSDLGLRAPVYLAVDDGNEEEEVKVRLPKAIAMKLLMVLSPTWTDDVPRVL
jgi:hypothetical protein